MHEEGDVGVAALDLRDGFAGVAEVAQVGLLADGFGGDGQELLEDELVELDYIKLAFALGDVELG